jgi:NAD(P)-dependent dehydrogenase (short-subunit alcohol dehydrogenase family)
MALKDKVVAITGAAGGLGPSVARAFAEAGAKLALAGRDRQKLVRLLDALGLPAGRRLASAVDLANETAARNWAAEVTETFGRVDAVIHLVGGYRGGTSIEEIPTADWELMRDSLIVTLFNVARAFVEPLKTNGWGRFIGVTSTHAQSPTAKSAVYAMARAAADALMLSLADELKGTGVTANSILVRSIITQEQHETEPKKGTSKGTKAEDIAAAMIYLCSEEAGAINGTKIPLLGRG